jgi:hypothetical protein
VSKRPSIQSCDLEGLRLLTDKLHFPGSARTALIFAAGVANNRKLLDKLGSQESSTWFEGRRAADPDFVNPYWPEKE